MEIAEWSIALNEPKFELSGSLFWKEEMPHSQVNFDVLVV